MNIYIIIINYNGIEDTMALLASIKKLQVKKINLIIVDNHSCGNDSAILNEYQGCELKIIELFENLGFSGGNNLGLKLALKEHADYILLLNNDTIVEPDFLRVLVDKFDKYPDIGIVSPQINYYSEPNKIWSAGGKISWLRGSGFSDSEEKVKTQNDRFVDFVSGCCMLIKSEVFKKIGLLDENYFLYIEDTDFCQRTRRKGYKILVTSDCKIYHKVSSSTARVNTQLPLYYTTRNRLYFSKKHFPVRFYISFSYIFFVMFIKSICWGFSGKTGNVRAVFFSFRDFLLGKVGKTELKF